jgi:uncharacterized damage-inducible protein DinB
MGRIEQLQEQLGQQRVRLLEAIEPLPDEALLAPNAVGNWSVAGLLGILTAWDAEVVTGLMRLEQNKKPEKLLAALVQPEAYNQQAHEDNLTRDLDAIFDDFFRVRRQLEEWLEYFSNKDMASPTRYPWFGRSLADLIADATWRHEASYVAKLKAFAEQWLAENPEPAEGSQVIRLTDILAQNDDT